LALYSLNFDLENEYFSAEKPNQNYDSSHTQYYTCDEVGEYSEYSEFE
jgi:hypothetical protein